jgi:hypothetical protein
MSLDTRIKIYYVGVNLGNMLIYNPSYKTNYEFYFITNLILNNKIKNKLIKII